MTVPPLANLFAIHDPDPAMLDATRRDLQGSEEFAEVWRPAPGWVAAAAPLPHGTPDDNRVRQHRLAFAEGRDVVLDRCGEDPTLRIGEIAELADFNPGRLSSLPGDFGFIRFRADGCATVVRSCGGLVPFYMGRFGDRFAISTRLGDFVRYLPDEPRLDALVNATWAVGWGLFPDGRTPVAGVSLLERGWFALIEDGEQKATGSYWNPRPRRIPYPTPALAREHAQRLRSLLVEKLSRDLDPDDGNLLTLSGGVDSSSLAALAAGVVGRKVWTWSLLPPKDREDLIQHEMSYIEPLAERYGFARRWSVYYRQGMGLDLWRAFPPPAFPVLHPALCSLPAVVREAPVRVLFGGEFADEVCGSIFTLPDWAEHLSASRMLPDPGLWLRHPRRLEWWATHRLAARRGQEALPVLRDLLQMDLATRKPLVFFHPTVQEEYLNWWEQKRKELRADPGPWRHLSLRASTTDAFVPMNWEACSALGIRRSLPFFNREVLELAFACHPAELYGPGTKKLLRTAVSGDVPPRNLYRADKGGWGAFLTRSRESVQEPLPQEPLPVELEAVLAPQVLLRTLESVGYWQFGCLTRLILFVESVRSRRFGRGTGKPLRD
ncbi:MAG: hypothetical protein HYX94_14035 [Chloroflexi bacterium]|nr:hypothetical protein [Chloroflexota bacterium]